MYDIRKRAHDSDVVKCTQRLIHNANGTLTNTLLSRFRHHIRYKFSWERKDKWKHAEDCKMVRGKRGQERFREVEDPIDQNLDE